MCITTSHSLAKELLFDRANGFITITVGEKEYTIDGIKKKVTHANLDDSSSYWTLLTSNECKGNIKR